MKPSEATSIKPDQQSKTEQNLTKPKTVILCTCDRGQSVRESSLSLPSTRCVGKWYTGLRVECVCGIVGSNSSDCLISSQHHYYLRDYDVLHLYICCYQIPEFLFRLYVSSSCHHGLNSSSAIQTVSLAPLFVLFARIGLSLHLLVPRTF